jgi:hypothetical protein
MSPDLRAIEHQLAGMIQRIAVTRKPISRTTAIYHDLHISGDDADELLTDIWKRFDLSSEKKMNFAAYFPNETESLGHYWISKLGFSRRKFRRLTVGHLIAVIERGEWFDPIEANV